MLYRLHCKWDCEKQGFESGQKQVFSTLNSVHTGSGSTQPHIQWVLIAIPPGIKRSGREADQSLPSNVEVKNDGAITSLLQMPSWHS
jgi:hypothetical protein